MGGNTRGDLVKEDIMARGQQRSLKMRRCRGGASQQEVLQNKTLQQGGVREVSK